MVKQAVPLQPMEYHGGAGFHAAARGGAHAGAGDLVGAAARGGPVLEQSAPEGWTPWYEAMWEQFWKSCCLWEAHARSVQQGLHPVGGTPQRRGQE